MELHPLPSYGGGFWCNDQEDLTSVGDFQPPSCCDASEVLLLTSPVLTREPIGVAHQPGNGCCMRLRAAIHCCSHSSHKALHGSIAVASILQSRSGLEIASRHHAAVRLPYVMSGKQLLVHTHKTLQAHK
jgi:hypothetical protein